MKCRKFIVLKNKCPCCSMLNLFLFAALFYYRKRQQQIAEDQEKQAALAQDFNQKRNSLSWYADYKSKGLTAGSK